MLLLASGMRFGKLEGNLRVPFWECHGPSCAANHNRGLYPHPILSGSGCHREYGFRHNILRCATRSQVCQGYRMELLTVCNARSRGNRSA